MDRLWLARGEGTVMQLQHIGHPASTTLNLSQGLRARIEDFGVSVDSAGKNGHAAPFTWRA